MIKNKSKTLFYNIHKNLLFFSHFYSVIHLLEYKILMHRFKLKFILINKKYKHLQIQFRKYFLNSLSKTKLELNKLNIRQ
jgi:hypothetical protein